MKPSLARGGTILPYVAKWRNAVRDSKLDATAKLTALTLSTFLTVDGAGYPSQSLLAAGASISRRSVGKAIDRLELASFLAIERSKGRSSHDYKAVIPTASAVPGSPTSNCERGTQLLGSQLRTSRHSTANLTTSNCEPGSHESVRKRIESE